MDSRAPHAASLEMEGTTQAMSLEANMPTPTERDRTKSSSTNSNKSLTGTSDSSPPRTSPRQLGLKTTPRSSRLLAPTEASAAKAAPPSLKHRKPLPSARPSSISRLPRRDASLPAASTPAPKWAARVAQREVDTEASSQYLRTSPPSVVPSSQRTMSSDKPLPPRPVASLVSAVSPSKDGRTLMDASENAIRPTFGDGWPTLTPSVTPRSISALERHSRLMSTDVRTIPSGIPRRTSGNTLTVADVSRVTGSAQDRDASRSRTSDLTGRSSVPSFVSAEESIGGDAHSESASVLDVSPRNNASPAPDASAFHNSHGPPPDLSSPDLHPRSYSLATSSSHNDLASETGEYPDNLAMPDDAKEFHAPVHETRKQNASPANFSRLRGAVQPHRTSLSSVHTPGTDRTASRIPISGSKKATLVHLKTSNLGSEADENSPTFGTRRLISPKALAMLDQGTKRRLDLQRAKTNNSNASARLQLVGHTIRDLRTSHHSTSSSPADTTGVSDSDSDELNTPISQPSLQRSGTMAKLTVGDPNTDRYEPAVYSSPPDNPRLRRGPPSSSKNRNTRPLETIQSQHDLLADQPGPGTAINGSFSKVSRELSQAKTRSKQCKQGDTLRDADRDELRGILTAAQEEDDVRQKDGVPGFDTETKNHLTRTLSLLEGQGTPPSEFIDYDKLHAMFGHISRRLSTTPRTNTFIDNATAANMFLERGSLSSEPVDSGNLEDHSRLAVEPRQRSFAAGTATSTPVISKWSDSTPSAIGESTELPRSKVPSSIGFPSATRIPSFTADSFFAAKEPSESVAATRNSSPTLGSGKLHQETAMGSVRRARENMNERGDIARMTRASMPKKTARTPTSASKGFRKPLASARSARGRDSSSASVGMRSPPALTVRGNLDDRAGRTQTISSTSNEPRSHSKGRTILNKMTGFFHKREKKSDHVPVPPLPPLDLTRHTSHTTLDVQIDNSNPFQSSSPPPLPEVPSLRRSPFQEPRPSSRATNASDQSLSSVLEVDNDQATTNVLTLTEKLISKAKLQTSSQHQARMLDFAMVLNDGLQSAREAKISAEKARQMAEAAEMSYRKTKKAVQMLERLASSLVRSTVRH